MFLFETSLFTLIIFFRENKLFQRDWGALCLTLWKFRRGGGGGSSVPYKYGKSREGGGGS